MSHRLESAATDSSQSKILANSAVMAAGTLVSRFSGYLRSILLAAALGNLIHADVFNIANTIPNMLYILLAGGAINAVLVPQLVRAAATDADRGTAYTQRVVTLVGVFLAAVTVLLVVAAPWVMQLFLASDTPPAGRDSAVDFARLCLPQVFFYGMFVLLGQILNARGRFAPMMWAPIANNVLSIGVLVLYLVVFGSDDPRAPGYGASQELLLGVGSTLGIVAQLLVLLPYLRAAGVTLRPRWDLRRSGLGHTLRLGAWTIGFVMVNQAAYTVVVRLASTGTAGGNSDGTGYTVYSSAFLIMMVPHSVITVSLATAILPRLSASAHAGDLPAMRRTLAETLRTTLVVAVPVAALLPVVASPLARLLWGYGAAAETVDNYIDTLILFGPGLVVYTAHYLILRGFFAMEQTRTVFWMQCVISAVNVAVAVVLVGLASDRNTAPALVVAYTSAYAVGLVLSYVVLRHRLGGLDTGQLVGFGAKLVVATAGATAAAVLVMLAWQSTGDTDGSMLRTLLVAGTTGLTDVVVFVGLALLLRLSEVTALVGLISRRIGSRQG